MFGVATGTAQPLVPFLGPEYGNDEIKGILDNCKARYAFHHSPEILEITTNALSAGKMVGWFSGKCEFGLRALGARSVFASPANQYACDNLSHYLKNRPAYMAYAVSMTREGSKKYTGVDAPYLSRSIRMPEYFGDSPVRLHTVSKADSPRLHELLETFSSDFGVAALLNTSLNYFEEPIACTPRDALKTYFASGLDLLVIDNFVLEKNARS